MAKIRIQKGSLQSYRLLVATRNNTTVNVRWLVHMLCVSLPLCAVLEASQVRPSRVQRLEPPGRFMSRREHVATTGGDGKPPTFSVSLLFFFLSPILCLRSSCGNSCLSLNRAKALSIPLSLSRKSGERENSCLPRQTQPAQAQKKTHIIQW